MKTDCSFAAEWTYESDPELYYDRRSVGQSILVSSPHLGLMTRFLLLSDNCGFVDCTIAALFASAVILRSESRGAHDHILLSQIWDSPQPGRPGPCIYIPQEQGGPVILPGTGLPYFSTPLLYESITCPPFILRCEPSREHYLQQFTLFRVNPLLCKRVLIP
jgi:hypothetical protein